MGHGQKKFPKFRAEIILNALKSVKNSNKNRFRLSDGQNRSNEYRNKHQLVRTNMFLEYFLKVSGTRQKQFNLCSKFEKIKFCPFDISRYRSNGVPGGVVPGSKIGILLGYKKAIFNIELLERSAFVPEKHLKKMLYISRVIPCFVLCFSCTLFEILESSPKNYDKSTLSFVEMNIFCCQKRQKLVSTPTTNRIQCSILP